MLQVTHSVISFTALYCPLLLKVTQGSNLYPVYEFWFLALSDPEFHKILMTKTEITVWKQKWDGKTY